MPEPISPPDDNQAHLIAPHPLLKDYYQTENQRKSQLNEHFDQVAPNYNWISQMASFATGRMYRRHALKRAGLKSGMKVLDIACGPGTLSLYAQKIVGQQGFVAGLDPSLGMLRQARKDGLLHALQGRAESLPFTNSFFDYLTMGYALRHVSDLHLTFREYKRVLKPGGTILILELARPDSPAQLRLSKWYFKTLVPKLAYWGTRNPHARSVMEYYWDTIQYCVSPTIILETLEKSGFVECEQYTTVGGLIRDYSATKP